MYLYHYNSKRLYCFQRAVKPTKTKPIYRRHPSGFGSGLHCYRRDKLVQSYSLKFGKRIVVHNVLIAWTYEAKCLQDLSSIKTYPINNGNNFLTPIHERMLIFGQLSNILLFLAGYFDWQLTEPKSLSTTNCCSLVLPLFPNLVTARGYREISWDVILGTWIYEHVTEELTQIRQNTNSTYLFSVLLLVVLCCSCTKA